MPDAVPFSRLFCELAKSLSVEERPIVPAVVPSVCGIAFMDPCVDVVPVAVPVADWAMAQDVAAMIAATEKDSFKE